MSDKTKGFVWVFVNLPHNISFCQSDVRGYQHNKVFVNPITNTPDIPNI